jgi:predicted nuclease of predicted toxin-antitoxin system
LPLGNAGGRLMGPERSKIRLLLDEHYPGWLADDLTADGVDAISLTAHLPGLRGADDTRVLEAAVADGRIVVTEDVTKTKFRFWRYKNAFS